MKKVFKYIWRSLAVLLAVIVLIYSIAFIYVSANRKSIIAKVSTEIGEKLEGTIAIGNVDISFFSNFPQVSVLFSNVTIRDSLYQQHKHTFFEAGKLFGHISILNVIIGKEPLNGLKLENASLYIYTDTSGYTTSYLFTPRKQIADTTAKPKNNGNILKSITLKNFRFTLANLKKEKLFDIEIKKADADITTTDNELILDIEKSSIIHDLAFNQARGSFAKEATFESDFELVFNKNSRKLSFKDMEVELKGHPFVFNGEFNFAGDRTYRFAIDTKQADHAFVKTLLTAKLSKALSVVTVEKPVDAQAEITGVLAPGEPLVKINWQTKNNDIKSIFFDVLDASFTGGYTNEVVKGMKRNDANSQIFIENFSGTWEGLEVQSKKAVINDLVQPIISTDLKSKFSLSTLNNLLGSNNIQLKEGNGSLDITYQGPMIENSNLNTFVNGNLSFSNGNILYAPRQIAMEKSSGIIQFKNSDVYVKDFKSTIKNNTLVMNGTGKNLLSLMKSNAGKISLDWHIFSPAINLEAFTSLLKKRTNVVAATASKGKLRKMAAQIDELLNNANIKLQVKSDKLTFKKFEATNVNAAIDMEREDYHLNDVRLQHANGSMRLNGKLIEQDARFYAAALNVDMDNVDVNKVLQSFNNFEQDAIKSENIKGKLSTNLVVSMNIDREKEFKPTNMEGFFDFSLKKGALINFEPLQKLQFLLFKNRNFNEIYFAELKDRIELKQRAFIINRMEIQSTAITLFVKGIYSLDGKTDLSIQVPLSNLKKRGEDFKPENIGPDTKAGPSIFVRGTPGDDGNIKFKLDVLNKIRKRSKSDPE